MALAGWAVAFALPADQRPAVWVSVAAAVVVQGPVGWWLIGTVGSSRFLFAWITGISTRIVLVALFALVLIPALKWSLSSSLISLVLALLAMLVVEVLVINREVYKAGES